MAFPDTVYTDNESAGAGLVNKAQAAGLSLAGLQPVAQLQSAVANLLVSDPSTVALPAADISNGTFGANLTPADTGIYSFPAQIGVGIAGAANRGVLVAGTVTAASASANGLRVQSTLVAIANSDVLSAIATTPTFTPGAFTSLAAAGLSVNAFSVAAFTTPGDPVGVSVGIITGTGATNGYAIRVAPPTGATNNYLIAHTTAATFNVTAAGAMTLAGSIQTGGQVGFAATVISTTAVATPSALAATQFTAFASTVSGAAVMGFGTTNDVALMNRAGTVVLGVGPNTTTVNMTGALTVAGAVTINAATQLGTAAGTDQTVIGGTGYGAGVASLRMNGLTTAATNNLVGTLTNSPVTGNPTFWMPISIAGAIKYIPCF